LATVLFFYEFGVTFFPCLSVSCVIERHLPSLGNVSVAGLNRLYFTNFVPSPFRCLLSHPKRRRFLCAEDRCVAPAPYDVKEWNLLVQDGTEPPKKRCQSCEVKQTRTCKGCGKGAYRDDVLPLPCSNFLVKAADGSQFVRQNTTQLDPDKVYQGMNEDYIYCGQCWPARPQCEHCKRWEGQWLAPGEFEEQHEAMQNHVQTHGDHLQVSVWRHTCFYHKDKGKMCIQCNLVLDNSRYSPRDYIWGNLAPPNVCVFCAGAGLVGNYDVEYRVDSYIDTYCAKHINYVQNEVRKVMSVEELVQCIWAYTRHTVPQAKEEWKKAYALKMGGGKALPINVNN